MRPNVVIGFLGSTLDAAKFGATRWNRGRPAVGLCMHQDRRVDRFELIHGSQHMLRAVNQLEPVDPPILVHAQAHRRAPPVPARGAELGGIEGGAEEADDDIGTHRLYLRINSYLSR